MSRVIMLLPKPDRLQLANCHKYVTRQDGKEYSEIYTTETIQGKCREANKILVISHGNKGVFGNNGADVPPATLANIIYESGIALIAKNRVAFDTCYAGYQGNDCQHSAISLVGAALKKKDPFCDIVLSGATGCSVTIGQTVNPVALPSLPERQKLAERIQAILPCVFGGTEIHTPMIKRSKKLVDVPTIEAYRSLIKDLGNDLAAFRKFALPGLEANKIDEVIQEVRQITKQINPIDKRLVVDDNQMTIAEQRQNSAIQLTHSIDPGGNPNLRMDGFVWSNKATSPEIKNWAATEYKMLINFALLFRTSHAQWTETSAGRSVKLAQY